MSSRRQDSDANIPILLVPGDQASAYDPDVPMREDILAFFRSQGDDLTTEMLVEHFKIEREATLIGLQRRLTAMVRDGQLANRAGTWHMVKSNPAILEGKVQGHRDGFGFFIPDNKELPDVYLPPIEMRKVLHGDRVRVNPTGSYKGKLEGSIVEVLERSTSSLVGRVLNENGHFVVVPEDQRIKHDVYIAPGDLAGAEHGQVVACEIIRQPSRHVPPQGKITEVLGEIDDPGMEIEIAVRKFDVPHQFSEATLAQAAKLPSHVMAADLQGRVDLRDLPFFTIDGEDARDFDDAIYGELTEVPSGKGTKQAWRLLVAIADVSHYVQPGQPIDDDAIERGTSVYFPRRVIPMLPESLSNGICSLNPDEDRLALVCDMLVHATGAYAGTVQGYQFYPAVICSHARTTYTQVWDIIQQPDGPTARELAVVRDQVLELYDLYQLFAQQRANRGALDFDTVETQIVCNDMGKIERIEPLHRNHAHRLIEEFMLAANTCAADFLTRTNRLGLYRVHEGSTPEKLGQLREYLRGMGLTLGGGDEPSSLDFSKLLNAVKARDDYEVIQTMIMRSMSQAIYTPENSGHFGLAYKSYTHFTSPIRRYPDLLNHRVIKAQLKRRKYMPKVEGLERAPGEPLKEYEHSVWERLGVVLSAYERRADEASYDVQAWLKCWYVREHIGEVFSGKVTGVTNFGLFVTLDNFYVEGLVHISELGSEYFQYNESMHELRGERTGKRYRLTDEVHVQITRVDLEARRIDFALVKNPLSFEAVQREIQRGAEEPAKRYKKAAKPKPEALRGTTAKQRRAAQRQAAKKKMAAKSKKTAYKSR
ncbi:Ribonuclease R [Oligella ureolytica]|uniref:Ribonuclease R n=2 Tax=Oligella ureolytica TaxID=90244 RepID=A0A378XHM6_9BURK|nr:Ribonuclease R [Oligella ureolytica]